jgi:hypothetical protein
VSFLSTAVQSVLDEGTFCAVATVTPDGPHCTPLVYAASGGRLWLTTSRRSVKARSWRQDSSISGAIRHGELAVTFTGTVKTYDALDKRTWAGAVAGATSIARATATFSRKNARFFAGYAFDARQIPLAWTPPGRVFVGVDLERTALLDADGVQEGRGRWGGEAASHKTFRRRSSDPDPLAALPEDVVSEVGRAGDGLLAITGTRGLVVLPVRWAADEGSLYAALPTETLALAGAEDPDVSVSLTIDKPSVWRAKDMIGGMIQGVGSCYVGGVVGSGAKTMRSIAADLSPSADALVRIAPHRVVWWQGWSSGSARLP